MTRVGLTGGIGAGKSAVAGLLREHGAIVVDADALSREVVEPGTSGLEAIVKRFGEAVLDRDGRLDRPALGALVFADDQARRDLEAIIHPRVRARAAELEAAAGPGAVVVHDVPLLVETGQAGLYDVVVVVDVPVETQIERLAANRGMSRAAAQSRIAVQATREQRLQAADVVLDNTGSLDELADAVGALWERLSLGVGESPRA
ncbi:dephospho-CoA kinase [Mumia sp. ZJ1417]|uniref:dephospho-CoA kinase n=1 Tax=Mumia sp. ZJ1417 TaxID=2708082 RepID=UPI00141FC112|nr:dephospho-CoA kinase [Mumia sp. ZJ1417]QMW67827.1 dephospho-CoA kinase [Mumia sp. ZJ1417]